MRTGPPNAEGLLTYQHLNNIFLALVQTSYAFSTVDPSLGSLHGTACSIFGRPSHTLEILRVDQTSDAPAATVGDQIELYYWSRGHSAANIIHEIGHWVNNRAGGYPPDSATDTSPLGLVRDNALIVSGEDRSDDTGPEEGKGRIGMKDEPFTQNTGRRCGTDTACLRMECIADMFLHWVYDQVTGDVFVDDEYEVGPARRAFMNGHMGQWMSELQK